MTLHELTSRQEAFVNAYVSNGRNGTQAAKSAGYSGDENSLAAAASRLLRVGKVADAIAARTEKAMAKAERASVADAAELIEYLTSVKRARAGDYLSDVGDVDLVKVKAAPEGLFRITPKGLEQQSPVDAAKVLLKYHEAKAGRIAAGALAEAIGTLPPDTIVQIARAMLKGPEPIDVTARLIG